MLLTRAAFKAIAPRLGGAACPLSDANDVVSATHGGGVYVQALHAVVSQRSCAAADAKYVVSRPGHPKYAWRLFCSLPRWRRTLEACIDSCQLTSRTQRFQAATAHAPKCCQSARERAAS